MRGALLQMPRSSSVMVPVAVGSAASVAFDGLDRVSVKVSSGSSVVSSVVGTVNVAVVWLAVTVTVPRRRPEILRLRLVAALDRRGPGRRHVRRGRFRQRDREGNVVALVALGIRDAQRRAGRRATDGGARDCDAQRLAATRVHPHPRGAVEAVVIGDGPAEALGLGVEGDGTAAGEGVEEARGLPDCSGEMLGEEGKE